MKRTLPEERPCVLLASAAAGGTIAAVRHFGALGMDVRVISSHRLSAAAWSRYVSRSYSAPPEIEGPRFFEQLLAIGAADPGQVLLATSDQTAWLYTENAARLSEHFRVYQPPLETMRRILDKRLLAEAAVRAGLAVLPSWDPGGVDDLAAMAAKLPYPILIKPRTHVHRRRNDKGVIVHAPNDLIRQYRLFVEREQPRTIPNPFMPDARLPLLQKFVAAAKEGIHSITGFIDRTGDLFVTRHSTKVLQRSRPAGVGICYESLPPDRELANAARQLCHEVGYFGIFEIEFVRSEDRWNVIDFNPRLFSQIGLEVRRGMPLPLLACLDAMGDASALRDAVANAQTEPNGAKTVLYDRFTLHALLLAQIMTSRVSRTDRAYWRSWVKQNFASSVDFAADGSDPMPGIIHALSEIYLGVRAFPRFLRSTPRVSPITAPALTRGQA